MFDTTPQLHCGRFRLDIGQPRIMGIVNVTPDSFSDGGALADADAAVAHALRLIEEGADIVDIGGESTRPGAPAVSVEDELARVLPVIEQLAGRIEVPISVDTSKPGVMQAALTAGASMVNDVRALTGEGCLDAVAASGAAVCLMHMQGEPGSMQDAPHYDDVVSDVHRFLAQRIFACEMSGIEKRRIAIDPGFGFGKSRTHNYELLRHLERFTDLGVVVLAGLSRKSMIGATTGREVASRVYGSVAAAVIAAQRGARILRVHDVAATRDALAVAAEVGWAAPAKATGHVARVAWGDED
ncbi:MAG: dihydropteroate synthase [Xanthomonadales bacterium]|nr:dihydropteroate synthase [Xanthomonadales bacterium]